jgi:hypothetical protein
MLLGLLLRRCYLLVLAFFIKSAATSQALCDNLKRFGFSTTLLSLLWSRRCCLLVGNYFMESDAAFRTPCGNWSKNFDLSMTLLLGLHPGSRCLLLFIESDAAF